MERNELIASLKATAVEMRKTALTMIHAAQSGHPGGSLSAADIMTALYFSEMNVRPEEPKWADRDRFVLSKGHVCPIQYSALSLRGFIPSECVFTLRKHGSILQGHPDMKCCSGIDISTGSLGQGFSCAVGMALAGKRDGKGYKTYCLVGDGECNEGQIWEAAQTASKYRLDGLTVIVDNNNLQNDGSCDDIMPTGDLGAKFAAFGFDVFPCDGHDMGDLLAAFDGVRASRGNGKPKCVVAKTVKGRGVSFMENVAGWHGMAPNDEQYRQAIAEIEGGLK